MKKSPCLRAELGKAWRLLTAPLRRLPDFLVPGAPKAGTSSLFDLIVSHPAVRRGARKEPTNFILHPGSELRARMHQPLRCGRFLCGDGSVEYFFHPDAARNAFAIVPQAKVIFLLRDPVARAWSEFRMFQRGGQEHEEFATVVGRAARWLSDPDAATLCETACRVSFNPLRYLVCGMYAGRLAHWRGVFPHAQTMVLFAEELFAHPETEIEKLFSFLGLPGFRPARLPHARDSGERSLPPPATVELLREFFAPHDAALRLLLDRALPWDPA